MKTVILFRVDTDGAASGLSVRRISEQRLVISPRSERPVATHEVLVRDALGQPCWTPNFGSFPAEILGPVVDALVHRKFDDCATTADDVRTIDIGTIKL